MKKSLDDIYQSLQESLKAKKENELLLEKERIEQAEKQQQWLEVNRRAAYAAKKVVSGLPVNFFIAGSSISSQLTYLSGNYRILDLQPYTTVKILNINEIVRNGNDLFLIVNFTDDGGVSHIIKLGSCYLINGFLAFKTFNINILPIGRIHGATFYRGYIYANNRPLTSTEYHTTIRIDSNNIANIISLQVPNTTTWQGQPTDILGYKGELYTAIARGGSNFCYFVKIDMNLTAYTLCFTCGNVSSAKRVRSQTPFIIYQDEVYIPTVNNASQPLAGNSIGISVYSLTGTIKREIAGITVTSGNTTAPFPHWFQIYNDKLIMTNTGSIHRWMARFDKTTLALEELYDTGLIITDDNSIMTDGYIYLNAEALGAVVNAKLIKVKYNNFTDLTVEIANYNNGYGSYGSIGYNHYLDV